MLKFRVLQSLFLAVLKAIHVNLIFVACHFSSNEPIEMNRNRNRNAFECRFSSHILFICSITCIVAFSITKPLYMLNTLYLSSICIFTCTFLLLLLSFFFLVNVNGQFAFTIAWYRFYSFYCCIAA